MKSVTDILREAQAFGLNPEVIERLLEHEQARDEREERASEREIKKLELELEEADKRRSHELAMAQLSCSNAESKSTSLQMYDNFRLPTFHDGQDEIDSYLQRFERLAALHKWDKQDYHVYLGSVLRGHALKVYVSLPDETVKDYEKLKEALLRAYSVDADRYRRLFRESKCGEKESYIQMVVRMEQYLDRWISLSDIDKDYNSLFDFLVREQLLNNCSADLRVFLKEHHYNSATEMAEAAERYRSAHNFRGRSQRISQQSKTNVTKDSELICHGCGKAGHIRPQCPENPRNYKKISTSKVNFVFESELKPNRCIIDDNGCVFNKRAEVMLDSGCSTIVVKDSLVPSNYKYGKLVKVYDYLGISNYFPQIRCFIKSKFFTGWVNAIAAPIKFADILIGLVPGVKIPPDSKPANLDLDPFESSEDPRSPPSNSPNHLPKVRNDVRSTSLATVMRVETRAMTERSEERKPLKCPAVSQLDIGKRDVINAQNTCPTLKSIREKVKTGKIDNVKNRAVKYEIINGLIYRICLESKFDHEKGRKQLIVPEIYKSKILNLAHDSLTAGHFSHRKTSHKIFLKFFLAWSRSRYQALLQIVSHLPESFAQRQR